MVGGGGPCCLGVGERGGWSLLLGGRRKGWLGEGGMVLAARW